MLIRKLTRLRLCSPKPISHPKCPIAFMGNYFSQKLSYSQSSSDAKKHKQNWQNYEKNPDKYSGFELALENDKIIGEELFNSLKLMGIETQNRKHTFSSTCDNVIKYIKLGAINKNISIQYCHYLAHQSRNCSEEDFKYYYKRALDLMLYLVKTGKELTHTTKCRLLCDVADTSEENCKKICEELIDQFNLRDKLTIQDISKILGACYRFNLWKTGTNLISLHDELRIVNPRLFDPLVMSLVNTTSSSLENNKSKNLNENQKEEIMEHLFKLMEIGYRDRVQFVTKYPNELIKGLQNMGLKTVINPVIKLSGRCTNCDIILPTYNNNDTSKLNESLKRVLKTRTQNDLRIYSSAEDLDKFENFLKNLYERDKKPIDCIIDGLNLCYRNTVGYFFIKKEISENIEVTQRRHNPGHQVQVLVNTMLRNNMLQMFKKILVIGRAHMGKWPGLIEFFDRHKIDYYFSSNETKDDLFQLYAATLNPKTILITNDFLRDHVAVLEGKERVMLERWIDTHQAWIVNKNLRAIWPTPYEKIPSVDRESSYFHIPIIDFNKLDRIALHEPPPHLNSKMVTWICARRGRLGNVE